MLQNRPLSVVFAGLHVGDGDFPPHHHEVWELIYQHDGSVITVQGDRQVHMAPGMILVHPPGVVHHDVFLKPYHLIYLFVDGSVLEQCPIVIYDDPHQGFGRLFEAVLREWNHRSPHREEMLGALTTQLEVLLRREAEPTCGDKTDRRISRAERILRNSLRDPISLDELAREVGVSRSWLHHMFRTIYHRSPHEYLLQLRLEKGLALLRHSSHKVGFVAAECGYSSTSHFTHHVKKETGLSPSEIRSSARSPEVTANGGCRLASP